MSRESLVFDQALHRYTLDGIVVPSVTGILKASGLINFEGIPKSILESALWRGTVVHQAVALYNEDDLDLDEFRFDFPSYAGYVDAWISFRQQRNFRPLLNEHRIASRKYQVAGTLDCLGVLDGQGVLLDYATGRAEDVCKWLQTGAYEGLAREWAAEDESLSAYFKTYPTVKRYAVELRKDGQFTMRGYTNASDFREFMVLRSARAIVEKYAGHVEIAA